MKLNGIKMAHHIHTEIDLAQVEIERLTGISLDEQRRMMMDAGLDWLEMITGGDGIGMNAVPRTQEFWGFWKTVWLHADKEFIRWSDHMIARELLMHYELRFYYETTHRISFDNDLINTPATDAGYHVVIKQLATKR